MSQYQPPQGPYGPGQPPGPQGQYGPPAYGAPPPKKRRVWLWVLIGILALGLFGIVACSAVFIGAAGSALDDPSTRPAATASSKPGSPKTAKPAPKAESTLGEGTTEVGVDAKAGRYKTTVPDDSIGCYWSRSKDDSGDVGSILSNDLLQPGASGSVTVKKGEFFKSQGCGSWKLQD